MTPENLSTLEDAATAWVVRLADQPSAQDWRAFEQWLAQAAQHPAAYSRALQAWQLAQGLSSLAREEDVALQAILANGRRKKARARQWRGAWALAASVLVASLVMLLSRPERWVDDWQADYHSRPAQVLHVALADGSTATLDGDSALDFTEHDGRRLVTLRRGAAFFEVSHTGTPFIVKAGGGEVQVLGTRFEVREQTQDIRVTVEQGRVAVVPATGVEANILLANQTIAFHDGQAGDLQLADLEQALAWRSGRLSFRGQSMGDVVATLQRYYPARILILDDALARRPVNADLVSTDPLAALAALRGSLGFQQMRLPGGTLLLH
ncbi:FecR family protein [Pseudomonas sp. LRF_L74]|uniref:FecR family protein n=1 Tax=Pseudomonas sp. LRF_L74 TaxID=3369422 RepID=UPI003F60A2B0